MSVEISCHGSDYIVRQILKVLIKGGARIARPGEFTQRAFLNGQFDLVQAEAVADLIAADSEVSHRTALTQLRGGFSKKLQALRDELIHFASLVELELDFGEEDVEFAQRDDLRQLIHNLQGTIHPLIESFDYGNALKDGVPVAIIGSPNVGKSTLLNALLNEEKAIVTEIAGTTRDVIEDTLVLEGLKFRFIDTAGIRETQDLVESLGIERSRKAMEKADVVLMLYDSEETLREVELLARELPEGKKIIWVRNKVDLASPHDSHPIGTHLSISAHTHLHLEALKSAIVAQVQNQAGTDTVVTNLRHYEHLVKTSAALDEVLQGLDAGITGDFLAQDIRLAHSTIWAKSRVPSCRTIYWRIFFPNFVSESKQPYSYLLMKKQLLFLVLTLLFVGAAPRKISWVAIGDSITYLNDHPDETGNRLTQGYLTQLTEHFPRVEYSNQGHNGWTAIKIAESLDKLGLVKADVYTVFLGTNDWWQGRPLGTLADYEQNTGPATVNGAFRLITDKLKQLNRKARIILITPMQRGDFVYISNPKNNAYGSYKPKKDQTLEQVANAVLEIGKLENMPVVDLYHKSGMNAENMVHYQATERSGDWRIPELYLPRLYYDSL